MRKYNYRNVFAESFAKIRHYIKQCNGDKELVKLLLLQHSQQQHQETDLTQLLIDFYEKEQKRELEHLFIQDDSLFEFFKNTKVKINENIIELFSDYAETMFVVHSKTESFAFFITKLNTYTFGVLTLKDIGNSQLEFEGCNWDSLNNSKIPKEAINILLYMTAFPDKVKLGIPNDYKSSSVGSVKNRVISKSEKIVSATKSTHFRSGFFRYYPKDSEHWKNVAGTSVWVNATVVNGNAKTITE